MATVNQGTASKPKAASPTKFDTAAGKIDSAYTAQLTVTGGTNINIVTPLPENYQLQLSTRFDQPFNSPLSDLLGGRAGPILGNSLPAVTGVSTQTKWLSSSVWMGGNAFRLTIPFVVVAKNNAKEEVVKLMRDLLKLVAPSEKDGLLLAPGPNLNTAYSGAFGSGTGLGTTGDFITIRLGNFFSMAPCVLEDVNCDFDTQMDVDSRSPMSATITVSAISYWVTTQQDIDNYFSGKIAGA